MLAAYVRGKRVKCGGNFGGNFAKSTLVSSLQFGGLTRTQLLHPRIQGLGIAHGEHHCSLSARAVYARAPLHVHDLIEPRPIASKCIAP